jgi:hypothetical protein
MFNNWGIDSQAHISSWIRLFSDEKKAQNFQSSTLFFLTFQHVFYIQVWNPDQPGDTNEATAGKIFIT